MERIIEKKIIKNKFGQYFTPKPIADFMISISDVTHDTEVLEPCCGKGVFIELLKQKGINNITAYEIDNCLATQFNNQIIYKSFISDYINKKFDLIIGNPPYIRWANLENELKNELINNELWNKYFNSLCDYLYIFILKSIELLKEKGQLIFICPEYWLNTTHSLSLRNYMVLNGYFEQIYHFNETPIFDKVTVSVIIFKYIKSKSYKKEKIELKKYYSSQKLTSNILTSLKNRISIDNAEYFEINQFGLNERWLLAPKEIQEELKAFEINCSKNGNKLKIDFFSEKFDYHTIGEICDIGNGMVSGLDKAFQLNGEVLNEYEEKSTIKVVKAKDLKPFYYENITKYIFITNGFYEEEVKTKFPNFYKHLKNYISDLLKRYNYNREIKFWEWVFLRNFNLFKKKEKRILVPCKERISNKNYFRFAIAEAGIFPTQDVTALLKKESIKENLFYILAMLNNHRTFNWLKYKGIVKGNIVEFSEKPISSIPIKLINWSNEKEVKLHNEITDLTEQYYLYREKSILDKINFKIDQLF